MIKKLLTVLALLLLLCGCGATEPGEKYMVSAIGVEKSGENTILYYKIADISASDAAGGQKVKNLSAKGENIGQAAENMNLGLELSPSLAHCEMIVISDKADKELFIETLSFCKDNEISLQVKLAVTGEIKELFSSDNTLSGGGLSGMLKVVSKTHGFGGHTALFEIETAVKVNNGSFALPYFEKKESSFEITGLGLYKNSIFSEQIGVIESTEYSKNKGISEEEGP